jgi:hypothetical protein
MPRTSVAFIPALLLALVSLDGLAAQTLEETLHTANVPRHRFSASELTAKITSFAISKDGNFLLGYYEDDGSGLLRPPLRLVRYDRVRDQMLRAELRDTDQPPYGGDILGNCFGSVLDVRERDGTIYVGTHINPSAGCLFVLTPELEWKAVLPGWLLGVVGGDYAIWRRNEIHFMSVHPMHIEVFDLKRNRVTGIYPDPGDTQRHQFSSLIKPRISMKWCAEHNAQCDPENFNTDLNGEVAVNDAARIFGFEASFDANGFGDVAEKQVGSRTMVYLFRERSGSWEYREFPARLFRNLFGGMSIQDLIAQKPGLAFQPSTTQ